MLTGGDFEKDKNNDWDRYIINSNLNGYIVPNDDLVWNWSNRAGTWTNSEIHYNNQYGIETKPVRGKLFVNNRWYGEDASRWALGTITNVNTSLCFRPKAMF